MKVFTMIFWVQSVWNIKSCDSYKEKLFMDTVSAVSINQNKKPLCKIEMQVYEITHNEIMW